MTGAGMDWRRRLQQAVQLHQQGRLAEAIGFYRDVLVERADNADALHLLGMALEQSGMPAEGRPFVEQAIRLEPRAAAYRNSLGNILKAQGDAVAAGMAFRAALDCDPRHAEAHNNLGLLEQEAERWPAAIDHFTAALRVDPDYVAARFNLLASEWMAGRQDAAFGGLAALVRVLPAFAPQLASLAKRSLALRDHAGAERLLPLLAALPSVAADVQFIIGMLAEARDDRPAAETAYQAALALDPRHGEALPQLAKLLLEREAHEQAVPLLEQMVARDAGNIPAVTMLGITLAKSGQYEKAVPVLQKAVALDPDATPAMVELITSLDRVNRFGEARDLCLRLIAAHPDNSAGYANLAGFEVRLGNIEAGIQAAEKAYALEPEAPLSIGTLANIRWMQQRVDEAEVLFRRYIAQQPDDPVAHNNLGLMLLRQERYAEGWPEYGWRWKNKGWNSPDRSLGLPQWDGRLPPPGRLLIWREQGIGDEILHAGLIPELLRGGADLVVATERRLVPLYARSFPGARIVPDDDSLNSAVLGLACQRSIGDVAMLRRPDIASFDQHPAAYLKADPDRTANFAARYRQPGKRLIGISWASHNPRQGRSKSMPLADMAAILREPDTSFVSLQYGSDVAEVETLLRETGLVVRNDPEVDPLQDIEAQAAQIAALDMVVTVSTAAAHLAAALGKPTLILVPDEWSQLWYWGAKGETSRWYPSVRLCRLHANDDRQAMIEHAQGMFRHMLAELGGAKTLAEG